jgi:hypothetical protein
VGFGSIPILLYACSFLGTMLFLRSTITMLDHVKVIVDLPLNMPPEQAEQFKAQEKAYCHE